MGINVEELRDKMSLLDLEDSFYLVGDFYGLGGLKEYNFNDKINNFYRVNILSPQNKGEFDILKLKISSDEKGQFSLEQQELIEFLGNLQPRSKLLCQLEMTAYKSGERAEKSYKLLFQPLLYWILLGSRVQY